MSRAIVSNDIAERTATISVNEPVNGYIVDRLIALRVLLDYTDLSLLPYINILMDFKGTISISWNTVPTNKDLDIVKNLCSLIGNPPLEHYLDGDKIKN